MAYWPNDGGRFNVIHLTDGSSMQVMGESSEADLSQLDFTRQHPQGQGFIFIHRHRSGTCTSARRQPQGTSFCWKQQKEQSCSKGYSRRRITTKKVHPLVNWGKHM